MDSFASATSYHYPGSQDDRWTVYNTEISYPDQPAEPDKVREEAEMVTALLRREFTHVQPPSHLSSQGEIKWTTDKVRDLLCAGARYYLAMSYAVVVPNDTVGTMSGFQKTAPAWHMHMTLRRESKGWVHTRHIFLVALYISPMRLIKVPVPSEQTPAPEEAAE